MKRIALTALAIASVSAGVAHADYQVSGVRKANVGTLGGAESMAYDVNNAGHIAGWAQDASSVHRAFLHNGVMTDVGATLGAAPSEAYGINNYDVVVGGWSDAFGRHGFRHDAGGLVELNLGAPLLNEVAGYATAINDAGQIAGQRIYPDVDFAGFSVASLWSDVNTFVSLYPIPETEYMTTIVKDVDANGRGTGWDTDWHLSWIWDHNQTPALMYREVPPPATPAGYEWQMNDTFGINSAHGVVGSATYLNNNTGNFIERAFIWNGVSARPTLIGVLQGGTRSVAEDVNNGRFVAGWSERRVYAPANVAGLWDTAFIYHRDFGMYALPRAANEHCRALALNERGRGGVIRVVGYCEVAGVRRAVRWDVTVANSLLPIRLLKTDREVADSQ